MASSRASAVLDSLMGRDDLKVRAPVRRTLFSRDVISAMDGRRFLSNKRRMVIALGLVVLLVGLGLFVTFGWKSLQRPLPIEERMPVAGAEGDSVAGSSDSGNSASADSGAHRSDGDPSSARFDPSAKGDAAGGEGTSGVSDGAAGAAKIVVHVAGAVVAPGVVSLDSNSRVVDAVVAAGGLRVDADPDRVNLAEPLSDGVRIVVPVLGQDVVPAAVPLKTSASEGSAGAPGAAGPVNLNTATAAELDELPGVGPATAAAIIAKRDKDGPFRSVESLLDVKGIGEAKLEALRDLVTVG